MKHFVLGRAGSLNIQFFRYLFVGGSSAILDLLVFAVLVTYFDVHYLLAAFIAYMAGHMWNYIISLLWIFESRHKRWLEFTMVTMVSIGGLMWTELLLWIAVGFIHMDPIISKMIVLWIVLGWNFGMRKLFVFR